jgi:hypothetical protein
VISRLYWVALGFVLTSLALAGDEIQLTLIGKETDPEDYLLSIGNDRTSNQIIQGGCIQNGRLRPLEMGRLMYKPGAQGQKDAQYQKSGE